MRRVIEPLLAETGAGAARLPGVAPRPSQKAVVECKLLHGSLECALEQGLRQTRAYMDRC